MVLEPAIDHRFLMLCSRICTLILKCKNCQRRNAITAIRSNRKIQACAEVTCTPRCTLVRSNRIRISSAALCRTGHAYHPLIKTSRRREAQQAQLLRHTKSTASEAAALVNARLQANQYSIGLGAECEPFGWVPHFFLFFGI